MDNRLFDKNSVDKFELFRFKYGPVCMLRVTGDVCDSGYDFGWEPFLPACAPVPAAIRSQPSAGPMPPSAPSPSSVLRPRSSSHPAGPCPSPSDRRRQSPNGSPLPERARDRRGRRGVEGEECGGVSAGGMAVAPPGLSHPASAHPFKAERIRAVRT